MAHANLFTSRTLGRVREGILNIPRMIPQHRGPALLAALTLLVAGVIAPLVGQQSARRGEREGERDSATLIRKRADWFFKQRAYPLGFIPAGARMKALQQMEQMRRTQGTLMERFATQERTTAPSFGTIPPLSTTNWTSLGPQPTSSSFFGLTSGRVNAIAVDPCDTTGNTVYVGGAQGGVWKTTDGGSTWTALTDGQPSLAGGSLALDPVLSDCSATSPSHTGAIYFGTGEENFSFDSFYGAGVLTSHDGGATWTQDSTFMMSSTIPQSADFAGPFIGSLAVDPATSGSTQVLLAGIQGVSTAVHSAVYQSTNGGSTWTKVLPSGSSFDFGTGVAFDPGDSLGKTAYAVLGIPFVSGNGLEANNGLWKSIDSGATWTRMASLDNAVDSALGTGAHNSYGRITLALAPGNPPSTGNTTIVVAIADISSSSSNLLGTFISTNGGTSFFQVNSGPFCNSQCFYDIAVGIDPANPNFIFLGGGPSASQTPVIQGASSVIFSANQGSTFADVSVDNTSGIPIHVDTHAFAFAHPTSGGNSGKTIVYVGDDGGVWSSSNVESNPGGQSWNDLNTNLSLTQFYPGNSIHPSNPQIGFAGAQDNGTQKFDPTFNPSNPQEWHDTAACGDGGWSAIDPSTPSTVYAACEDIGQLGTINKNQLDGEPGGSGNTFGENWLAVDTPAIDADTANFVPPLVLDTNLGSTQNLYFGTCRVWQSTNGGLFWNPISPALDGSGAASCASPSALVTTIAVAPTDSNTVYAGTDVGKIWATSIAGMGTGATFGEIDKSGTTPQRTVTQIAVSPASPKISYVTFSGFSSCGSANGCDGLGHIFKIDCTNACTYTNITGNLPDIPVNDIVIDPNDNTNNTIYIATDIGVFDTTNGGSTWSVFPTGGVNGNGLPHVECTSLKLNNTARVLRVGTHGRGDWDLQLTGLPASALTGISPVSAIAGGAGFTLTLNGQGFGANPAVSFGSTQLTSVGSGSQLTVLVPSSAITGSGEEAVTVSGASGSLNFSVEGPVPGLSNITPTSVSSTTSAVTITVTGSNFTSNTGLAWTPGLGSSQQGNSTILAQQPGGTSTSFTVSVPASLLQSTLAHMVPVTPSRRPWPGGRFWFLAAFLAAVLGLTFFILLQKRRRLVFGASLATVIVLLSVAGCGGGSSSPPPPPPPGSVQVAINAYTPGPGGGISSTTLTFTVQ